ncbi:MAG: hypothetical protein HY063_13835 [Bacteroidetes bacterium]|nr:hypothetical protein [Bacteroidota bacterium]
MKNHAKIVLCFFLAWLFFFYSGKCFSQRVAENNSIISGAKNIAAVAAPIVKDAYKREENRNAVVKGISNLAGQAVPLAEKAAPIMRKGFVIGKKILKVLKKILR